MSLNRQTLRDLTLLFGVLFVVAGCGDDGESPTASAAGPLVFGAELNRLNAYDPHDNFRKQVVVHNHNEDPNGRDINGQICFTRDGSRRFIAGEDTGQPNPPQGWGFFQLHGTRIGELSATQIGKLTPTYQSSPDNAENYGCGFLSDGRLLTTDVGDQASGPANGQLIIWFPPFDAPSPHYCKLDTAIGTAGGIWIDSQDRIYVASAREHPGIYLYTGPFPTSDTAAGQCGQHDSSGAPLATQTNVQLFIGPDAHLRTPSAIVQTRSGSFYVSSVFNGVIAEYDSSGRFVRRLLQPRSGESLPYPSTGTPFGIGLDASGTLYYADIGIVQNGLDIGPGPNAGTVRRIRFANGAPQPPETMDRNLNFPDGIGVLE
jgi:hypothetical protein